MDIYNIKYLTKIKNILITEPKEIVIDMIEKDIAEYENTYKEYLSLKTQYLNESVVELKNSLRLKIIKLGNKYNF